MLSKSVEKTISWFLFIGVPFTTVFIWQDTVTDPVNITKLFAAGCVGVGAFSIALIYGFKELWRTSKALVIASLLFVAAMINTVINSAAPTSQNIYGVFGRNTGLVAYMVLAMIALSASLLRARVSFERIIWGLIFAGAVNVLYCGWALAFGDFIHWNNPYGNILGLFGNPDFISAFLGMFISGSIAYAFGATKNWWVIPPLVLFSGLALYEIIRSHAIQGLVVTAAGLAMVGFYLIRGWVKHWAAQLGYVVIVAIGGAFALAGALQKGPLAHYIYKKSVSLRGSYWEAGMNIGKKFPWTGAGLDSYGTWYRALRPDRALVDMPGVGTVTNASHNVVIDFFANGGYPLLVTYLATLVIGLYAIIRVTLRAKAYDGIFVALTVTWLTYELQSIISINQIGLAIWGWVLVGALVAYEYATRPLKEEPTKGKTVKQKELIFSPQLVGGIGVLVGALIAVPPLSADSKWRSAVTSGSAQTVEAALVPTYLTPADTYRYANAVQTFESSKLYDLAYKYAKIGVEFNPDSFDAWHMLYGVSKSTQADKDLALSNMKRLDPKNPNVLGQ
jgi:O-antigen ligase